MSNLIYSLEDDEDISRIIKLTLEKANYDVKCFNTGKKFLDELKKRKPDLILLDLMLPDCSGIDILKKIKADERNDSIQIIIVSAKNNPLDKVEGLDLGADDYIEKPFNLLELQSRVDAKFRRLRNKSIIKHGDIILNTEKREVIVNNKAINLTNMEYEILACLFSNYGKAVTRDELFSKIYGSNIAIESRTLDMHIKTIRKKIGDNKSTVIKTLYGIGYMIG